MSDCKIYPADTIDIYGNVWETVGENIRNGMFGENVKSGYVYINEGNITSTDFTITNKQSNSFKINNVNSFFVFPVSIESGGINTTIENAKNFVTIRNSQNLNDVIATIKIIYKEVK